MSKIIKTESVVSLPEDESNIEVTTIFPKNQPEFQPGPIYDECGFTLNERLALRQAWNLIKPFERRYGKEIYFQYLLENHNIFEHFRYKGKFDMHRLHGHALALMRFLHAVIEQNDPALFQSMLIECHNIHNRCNVSHVHIKALLAAHIDYVLQKLKNVSSASLKSGFERLLEKFQFDQLENQSVLQQNENDDDKDEIIVDNPGQ